MTGLVSRGCAAMERSRQLQRGNARADADASIRANRELRANFDVGSGTTEIWAGQWMPLRRQYRRRLWTEYPDAPND